MNTIVLGGWKDRLHAAEGVLSAAAFHERRARRALRHTVEALDGAIERVEENMSRLDCVRHATDASKRQHATLLRNLPIAAIATSRLGEITTLNPAAMALLGTSDRSATGKSLLLFLDDRGSWFRALQQLDECSSALRRPVRVGPKERAPESFFAIVVAVDDLLQWFFLPTDPEESLIRQMMP